MSKKPLILVTNDDGITAPGIRALIEAMKTLGDVVVVAPDSPQSGMGHAITVNSTLHLDRVTIDQGDQPEYSCSGTPADCVKLAVREIMDRQPDICVSGINHGANSSINVIYSGTMSAALEAGIEGIPAIGFSLCNYNYNANFDAAKHYAKQIVAKALAEGIPKDVVLNVNFPDVPQKDIKGIRICRQAKANWIEEFDKRQTPHGKDYYWLTGTFVNQDNGQDTDEWALENNYISIVPVQFDLTAHHSIQTLNSWDFND
ncbi:stationary phase survival protein SurE [Mangrovimonas yunxiaonensis]|uniref:5'-nucleotidase SurE n=1 Tax=Mangrovimonas yunxiaonensis TaxID=1197477 RepID=A0A084TLQ1_9FLAO|nr:5'/3'-nucleotidase SurE [Mangrovimonas yunxiaonensis]KFB01637.1 stationary phase survival protein SurE [Mangrovimonas yunxiaonensis]GGH35514.1 5'-nucleotidase SurE [Mangrovimonas yunxiaonensis]